MNTPPPSAAAGGAARRVTRLDGLVNQLAWTPDGSELSFLYVKGDVHPVAAVSATKAQVGVIGQTGVERQRVAVIPTAGRSRSSPIAITAPGAASSSISMRPPRPGATPGVSPGWTDW